MFINNSWVLRVDNTPIFQPVPLHRKGVLSIQDEGMSFHTSHLLIYYNITSMKRTYSLEKISEVSSVLK